MVTKYPIIGYNYQPKVKQIVIIMVSSKYLIVPILAVALFSCKQKNPSASGNAIVKTDTPRSDSISIPDTNTEAPHNGGPVPLAQLIVPGTSLGQTTINENGENIYKRLGKPDAGDAAMGKSVSIWYAGHDTAGNVTQMYFSRNMGNDETSRVKAVRVTSPFFKINNKVYAGMPLKDILSLYTLKKVATFTDKGNNRSLYDNVKGGIAVDVDDKEIITGITVHERGKEVTTAYQAFSYTLKY